MAALAVALFILAQPRMFCAVHCLILDHIGGDAGTPGTPAATSIPGRRLVADGASAPPVVDTVCGRGESIVTSAPAIPVGSVGPASPAAIELPTFGEEPPVPAAGPALRAPMPVTFPVATPPPRT
jgi:hypothetical protein